MPPACAKIRNLEACVQKILKCQGGWLWATCCCSFRLSDSFNDLLSLLVQSSDLCRPRRRKLWWLGRRMRRGSWQRWFTCLATTHCRPSNAFQRHIEAIKSSPLVQSSDLCRPRRRKLWRHGRRMRCGSWQRWFTSLATTHCRPSNTFQRHIETIKSSSCEVALAHSWNQRRMRTPVRDAKPNALTSATSTALGSASSDSGDTESTLAKIACNEGCAGCVTEILMRADPG